MAVRAEGAEEGDRRDREGEESQEGTGGVQTVRLVEKGVPGSESDRGLLITTTHPQGGPAPLTLQCSLQQPHSRVGDTMWQRNISQRTIFIFPEEHCEQRALS